MGNLLFILLATFIDGLIALVGAFFLFITDRTLKKILLSLVAFSAGALLSGGFYHLLAESIDKMSVNLAFSYFMIGFVSFFILERILRWRHCHKSRCEVHPFSYLILFGDGIHNFIDGLIIGASFLVSSTFGWITTLLIIAHEIPQELGDFGVLVYGGFGKIKALLYNFLSQLTCMAGGLYTYFFLSNQNFLILLPFAAGGFIYISASDLIPELHKEPKIQKSLVSFSFFLIGVFLLVIIKVWFGG